MALAETGLPYGLRDLKVAPIDSATGEVGFYVKLPNAQTLEFNETTSVQVLRGDDTIRAQRTQVNAVEWSLSAGGIRFEAMKVIAGGTLELSGTTPNAVKTWKRKAGDAYPDFAIDGQAISESGGDHHTKIHRAKANNISGAHQDEEFWMSNSEGTGIAAIGGNEGDIWDLIQNETAAAVVEGDPEA